MLKAEVSEGWRRRRKEDEPNLHSLEGVGCCDCSTCCYAACYESSGLVRKVTKARNWILP